jgi:hypothetical protein
MAVAGYGAVITAATLAGFVVAVEMMAMNPKSVVTIALLTLALSQLWHVFNMRCGGRLRAVTSLWGSSSRRIYRRRVRPHSIHAGNAEPFALNGSIAYIVRKVQPDRR